MNRRFYLYVRPVVYLCACLHGGIYKTFNVMRMLNFSYFETHMHMLTAHYHHPPPPHCFFSKRVRPTPTWHMLRGKSMAPGSVPGSDFFFLNPRAYERAPSWCMAQGTQASVRWHVLSALMARGPKARRPVPIDTWRKAPSLGAVLNGPLFFCFFKGQRLVSRGSRQRPWQRIFYFYFYYYFIILTPTKMSD